MPESLEATVARAVTAAWEAMWVHDSQAGMTIVAPPAEAENPSLWRQVRAVVDAVSAAAPRADTDKERTAMLAAMQRAYHAATCDPKHMPLDQQLAGVRKALIKFREHWLAARAPGRKP